MNNNTFIFLILAILTAALYGSSMNMVTADHEVTAFPNQTITVDWDYVYTEYDLFGSPGTAAITIRPMDGNTDWNDRKILWEGTMEANQHYTGEGSFKVPDTPGDYYYDVEICIWSDELQQYGTLSGGGYTLTVHVLNLEELSIWEKIKLLINMIITWLTGGK